jgi:hypothetical protein
MVCLVCGFPNDPASATCARCNTALAGSAGPAEPAPTPTPWPSPAESAPAPTPWPRLMAPPPPRRSRVWLVAGIAVAVLLLSLAGVGVVAFRHREIPVAAPPGGPAADPTSTTVTEPTATATGSAQEQAAVVDHVLDQSVRSRAKLNQSIDKVGRCTQLSLAVSDMRAAGDERRAQLKTVDTAGLDRLSNGEQMRSTLRQALSYALQADQDYLAWAAPTPAGGCGNTSARSAAYSRGRAASTKAGAAKTDFLDLWNPVAADLGLPTRTRDDI